MELLKLVLAMVLSMPPANQPAVDLGYTFALKAVVRELPDGRAPLKGVTPNGVSDDEVVTIKWAPAAQGGVYVWVINKSAAPAEVQWDETSYVAPDGVRQRTRRQGGPFKTIDEPQAPTVIAPGAKIADMLVPVASLYQSAGHWRFRPLLPTRVEMGKETDVLKALQGRTLQASLAITQAAVLRRYTATFAIGDIKTELSGSAPATANAMAEQPQATPSVQPTPAPTELPTAAPTPLPTAAPAATPGPTATPKPLPSRDKVNDRRETLKDYR